MTPSLRLQFWTLFCVSILSACPAFKGEHAFLAPLQNGSGPWSDAGSTGGAGTLNDYEAFWRFDDLADASGHGHALVDRGVVAASNRMGQAGKAFDFTFDGLEVSSPGELNFTTELSISAWINTTDASTDQKVVSKINGSAGYVLGIQNGQIYPEVFDSGGTRFWYQDGACLLSTNQWYHIVMTWKTGGQLKTYLNGTPDKSIPVGPNPIGEDDLHLFTIGDGSWAIGNFRVLGLIDDVRIYGRELSASEVTQLYGLPAD